MNPLSKILNIKFPIIQGGMGNISNAILTSAVSNAGGLGTIGAGTMTPKELQQIIIDTKLLTSRPFAVNIPISITPYLQELIELIIKEKVPVVSLSAGNPTPLIKAFHEHGIKVITVVAQAKQAVKAEAAGTDVIVAEGFEAAGINSNFETTTMTLIPQIVDSVSIPVAAAGGIGDGRGLAAAFLLGASGVQMGTRFIATQEAPFHDNYKQKVLHANDVSTYIIGRKVGRTRRVIDTPYTKAILQREKETLTIDEFQQLTSENYHKIGALDGDFENGYVNGGQIVGLIKHLPSVSELIEQMIKQAKQEIKKVETIL
jgi:enoyl-[acyl-carrier protein] reductase II